MEYKFPLDQSDEAKSRLEFRRDNEMRTCKQCGTEKWLRDFHGHIIKHMEFLQVSFLNTCKQCRAPGNVARVKKAKKSDPIYARACTYWRRSKLKGIPSDLKLRDIRILLTCPCYYCGGRDSEITIDRKDSDGGYTRNNTVPCCFRCNTLKSDMPLEAWHRLVPAIRNIAKLGIFGIWRQTIPSKEAAKRLAMKV